MRLRGGFYKIVLDKILRLDFGWFFAQAVKLRRLRSSFSLPTGKTTTGPIIAHFFITRRCNLKCFMCDIPDRKAAPELTTAECKSILDQIKEAGSGAVSFTGGEPLLREDIFELLAYARSIGLDTILVTNGILLQDKIDKVIKALPAIVDISLDGSTPEVHDRIRGMNGAFEKTSSAIRQLSAGIREAGAKTDVVISVVLSSHNRNDVDNILEYCRSLNASRVILNPVHNFDKNREGCLVEKQDPGFDISASLMKHKLRRLIDNSDYYLSHLWSVMSGNPPPAGCPSGYTTLFIDWESNVYPCKAYLELGRPIFNLKESGKRLKEIWYSREFDKFRVQAKNCQLCYLTVNREFDTLFR